MTFVILKKPDKVKENLWPLFSFLTFSFYEIAAKRFRMVKGFLGMQSTTKYRQNVWSTMYIPDQTDPLFRVN